MTDLCDQIAERITYRLTFDATGPRAMGPCYLEGPGIPDAYNPDAISSGDWCHEDGPALDDPAVNEHDWLTHYLSMAIGEAVHEALEWFQVDGKPWVDPHGEHDALIARLSNELADKLASLAKG